MTKALLWLAEDLRMEDNLALDLALSTAYSGCRAVRIQPEARGRPQRTANRQALEDAAELELAKRLSVRGISLVRLGRGDRMSLTQLCRESGCGVVIRNAADGSPAETACRDQLEGELAADGIPLLVVNGELIRRSGPGGERPDEPYLTDDESVAPSQIGAAHPIALLRAFLKRLPDSEYEACMWTPVRDRMSTSQLSTHFAAGTLSSDRACLETMKAKAWWLARHPGQAGTVAGKSFGAFHRRVNMRKGFLTSYSKRCSKYEQPLTAPSESQTTAKAKFWRMGQTGIPMPDAAMRELAATGWINFRMRQLSASYGIQLLGLHPDEVGVALGEMFDDYEPGITWLQVAINDGTLAVERGPRILNPVKQGHDLDPDETYVRRWIPELAGVPMGLGHEPWLAARNPLASPLIDHRAALRTARSKWPSAAREAVQLGLFD